MPKFPEIKKKKVVQQGRKKNDQKFYNSTRWRKIAKQVEREHPLCQECERNGKVTDATGRLGVTDHILPIRQGGLPYDRSNLQRLCNRCHNRKSGKETHG